MQPRAVLRARRIVNDDAPRRIWLCADDYGISDGVNRAIRDLIERGRLNATSVMIVGSSIGRNEVAALQAAAAKSPRCAIGLHATLTAPFRPLTMHFRPTDGGMFPAFPKLLRAGLLRRLDGEMIHAELQVQLATFKEMFGRAPDFVDAHQHAQLFPQVRDAFLRAVKEAAPDAWVRQGGRHQPLSTRLGAPKALVLDLLSAQFRKKADAAGVGFNPAFAGAYDFTGEPDFGELMQQFLDGLPQGGLVMCHPGFVDDTLIGLDPLTTAPYACSGVTTYSALKKVEAAFNTTIVIFGAGGLGLMALSLLKAMGGKGAIIVDIDARKREAAEQVGALASVDGSAPDALEQLARKAGGPIRAVIDLVGNSQSTQLGFDCLTKGGKLVIVGLFGGGATFALPLIPIKAVTIQGSYVGNLRETQELLDLVRAKNSPPIPVTPMPLAKANDALVDLQKGKLVGRAVLTP